ncbi:hypothetical protein DHD05_10735 [Arenibacter sp. N53]|uniref:RteC protein n=1 Tax=Arenibacter echinorum TaxID=440515 RepID=A0A327R152_9FLAO|nr:MULTISPECIES: RteC domain-containing protein [Arenibacter]MCM4152068.1 hypothetical protein [Arenibacter sp. N53]RAJ10370.1 RteC protein [Arenibacter echinorum]
MDWVRSRSEIESELLQIEQSFSNPIASFDKAISFCQKILEDYRKAVIVHGFPDEASEIRFFKKDKPLLFGLLLRYSHQLTFELDFPNIAYGMNNEIIVRKIRDVNAFLAGHKDMVLYLELENSALDSQYFLRKNRNLFVCTGRIGHSFDSEFSASHDVLIAQILGYQGFLQFLQQKLSTSMPLPKIPIPKINWTGSKIALTELGFALFYSGIINHGNASLKSVMLFLEQVTGVGLGDYHHTSVRIRNRTHPTKFLDKLKNSLQYWITDLDD